MKDTHEYTLTFQLAQKVSPDSLKLLLTLNENAQANHYTVTRIQDSYFLTKINHSSIVFTENATDITLIIRTQDSDKLKQALNDVIALCHIHKLGMPRITDIASMALLSAEIVDFYKERIASVFPEESAQHLRHVETLEFVEVETEEAALQHWKVEKAAKNSAKIAALMNPSDWTLLAEGPVSTDEEKVSVDEANPRLRLTNSADGSEPGEYSAAKAFFDSIKNKSF